MKLTPNFNLGAATLAAMLGLAGLATSHASEVPNQMNYQAFVTDASNMPLGNGAPTNFEVIFRVYDSATSVDVSALLWAEKQVVTVFNGNFSVLLGNGQANSSEPKPDLSAIFNGDMRYIGITVETGGTPTEFTPRQRLVTNAYAFRATVAEQVGDQLYLDNNGNVGVGTATPLAPVTIKESAATGKGQLLLIDPSSNSGTNGATGVITAFGKNVSTGTTGRLWALGNLGSSDKDLTLMNEISGGDLNLGTNGTFDQLVVKSNGNVEMRGALSVAGQVSANGLSFPSAFNPDPAFVGTAGNYISFGHSGSSEDFIGYKNQVFYFRDSLDGGDTTQPSVDIGGSLTVGGVVAATTGSFTGDVSGANGSFGGTVFGNVGFFSGSVISQGAGVFGPGLSVGPGVSLGVNGQSAFLGQITQTQGNIVTLGSVFAGGGFSSSDARIKRAIKLSDGTADLRTLMGVKISDYSLIDTKRQGFRKHKKVIAQQVKKVFPQAIHISTGAVPDIYRQGRMTAGFVQLDGMDKLKPALAVGDRVRLDVADNAGLPVVAEVTEVTDEGFRVEKDLSGEVFIYGHEVDDFHFVDYDALSMLNLSATQELHRLVQKQGAELKKKEARIVALEEDVRELRGLSAQVTALQKQLTQLAQLASSQEAAAAALQVSTAR